jgi:D-lactate dehydrogenase (cytochrome)
MGRVTASLWMVAPGVARCGLPVARIELADAATMEAVNRYSKMDLPVAPTLWMDFHGTEASVAEQARTVERIAGEHGGTHFAWATDPEERRKLWQARYDAYYALKATRPGGEAWVTDVCVPISQLAQCITETQNDIAAGILGHAGEGNFHVCFNLLSDDLKEMAEAKRLNERLVHRALALSLLVLSERLHRWWVLYAILGISVEDSFLQ